MKKILFDMDWTLYSFENGQYTWSRLESEVQSNALKLLKILEWDQYLLKFEEIKLMYWEDFSLAFEDIYRIKKEDYFNKTWDIIPDWFILDNRNSLEVFNYLKSKWYDIFIISESPKIWINRVLTYLKVNDLLSWIYSWQWNERKSNWLLYERMKQDIWTWYFMVWDQIKSDIEMSKKSWYRPILISQNQSSQEADYNIKSLTELYKIIS